jgi:hypothetical protein
VTTAFYLQINKKMFGFLACSSVAQKKKKNGTLAGYCSDKAN